ncbi:YjfB family protein [Clostridium saccharobutylicum]|uniref:Motility protein n=1 Tax=Clostridium saccharobutylicum TaxID=169679 RepID=A0A1S8NIJ8_CLOSA|nr:YjfB family protein [Clostridium saccharobutylicum]OOM16270.1 hypothetical protein CLOSAC_05410 [Clostridium saccharobutylicum]
MDIGVMSMAMGQSSLATAVGVSVLKLGMNAGEQTATQMTDMIQNMAIEPDKGIVLDVRV